MNTTRYKKAYGTSAGNPKGRKPNYHLCAQEIWIWPSNGWSGYQCSRKRGHGIDGAYCKQHAKETKNRIEGERG